MLILVINVLVQCTQPGTMIYNDIIELRIIPRNDELTILFKSRSAIAAGRELDKLEMVGE